ncbi:carbohydrate ABC transporter permease [Ruminiclostridium cellulolyticum]|uniref:Binding-protein-dependent transport systems inner membrane component n=1 Tax=Ruminiclostridium cellulolyticum (strain ATCC 35319 / DSM 5812 / JCM 6584 / H10) TaxID=394503 RepID=B8I4H8_RUMCH|nr:carbohydrate ABC transporter permease [Ruminiclostridium cellulolyticum]ACL74532.1 binding-protein-dependent transport systems inner membrane component [Ruminiclostridium cellulolyticum H10]
MIYKTSDKVFNIFINSITLISVILCLFPVLNVVAVSLSSNSAILASKVFVWPIDFNIESYKAILKDTTMIWSLVYTIIITFAYTAIGMFLTICAAYPLTKQRLRGRNAIMLMIIFTMYFSGGLIPDYMLVKNLNMLDSSWSLILPGVLSAFNLIVLKTFFTSLPESLEESAILDGCNDIGVLFKIVLPLSKPVLATLSLFYAVGKWNSFMDALFYISDSKLYPLQLKLYQIIVNSQTVDASIGDGGVSQNLPPESLKAACVVFATLPIVLVYPKLQKYFVSGIMIGAVKG